MLTKNRVVLVLFFLVAALILCFRIPLNNTLKLYKEYRNIQERKVLGDNYVRLMNTLANREKKLDSIIGKLNVYDGFSENRLIQFINDRSDGSTIVIAEIASEDVKEYDYDSFMTTRVQLSGKFSDILNLLYELEASSGLGRVTYAELSKTKKRKSKAPLIYGEFLLESKE